MQFIEVSQWRDEADLLTVPPGAGVFRIEFDGGPPYVGKTADLRRRLRRLLVPRQGVSARLTLREVARGVHYRRTGSAFESSFLLYRAVRRYRPRDGRDFLKLRPAPFVKVLMGNRFPRTCVTQRLARSQALFYGPFPTRNAAEQFQKAFLDLFQVRRCTENLAPSRNHPGCIWGEMGLCLRPCQAACDDETYASEVGRMADFLATDGESLLRETEEARNQASASMEFEDAARHHRALAKAKDALRLRGALSREIGAHCGIVFQRSAQAASLELTPLDKAARQEPIRLRWEAEPRPAALRAAIRDELARGNWSESPPREQEEHLALLQRWHGSSYRKGEFVPFASIAEPPLRTLANAAMRVATS